MKFLLTFVFIFSGSVMAFDKEGPCLDDAKRLCGQHAGMAMFACMREKKSEVSKECRESLGKAKSDLKAHRKDVKANCKAEVEELCGEAKGPVAKKKCLEDNREYLPEECRSR